MIELISLALTGLAFIKLGFFCLKHYEVLFFENPKAVITWDLVVQILDAGTSWGRIGVTLISLGAFFFGMSAIVLLRVLLTILIR